MKKIRYCIGVVSLIALFVGINSAWAQPPSYETRMQRIEALKVAYFTKALSLTPDEAKTFWPLYNAYRAELRSVKQDMKLDKMDSDLSIDQMKDADVEQMVTKMLEYEQKEVDIKKKYLTQFKGILPIAKVAKLYRAEEGFKRQLLELLKDK